MLDNIRKQLVLVHFHNSHNIHLLCYNYVPHIEDCMYPRNCSHIANMHLQSS